MIKPKLTNFSVFEISEHCKERWDIYDMVEFFNICFEGYNIDSIFSFTKTEDAKTLAEKADENVIEFFEDVLKYREKIKWNWKNRNHIVSLMISFGISSGISSEISSGGSFGGSFGVSSFSSEISSSGISFGVNSGINSGIISGISSGEIDETEKSNQ